MLIYCSCTLHVFWECSVRFKNGQRFVCVVHVHAHTGTCMAMYAIQISLATKIRLCENLKCKIFYRLHVSIVAQLLAFTVHCMCMPCTDDSRSPWSEQSGGGGTSCLLWRQCQTQTQRDWRRGESNMSIHSARKPLKFRHYMYIFMMSNMLLRP